MVDTKRLFQTPQEFEDWKQSLLKKEWLSVPDSPKSYPAVATIDVTADRSPGSWYSLSIKFVYLSDFQPANGGKMSSPAPRRKLTWEEAVERQNVEQINRHLREKGFKLVKFPSSTVVYKNGVNLFRSHSPKAAVKRIQKSFPEEWPVIDEGEEAYKEHQAISAEDLKYVRGTNGN